MSQQKDLSRRGFLLGTGAAALALSSVVAGCSAPSASAGAGEVNAGKGTIPEAWDEEYDIVIVGAGGAGCAAAYGAAKAGGGVLVIDSQSSSQSSSTALCGGYTYFVNSPLQQEQGIEDSIDLFVSDTLAYGQSCKEEVLRTYGEHCNEYYALVTDELGLQWTGSVNQSPGCSVPRTLVCDPAEHQRLIAEAALAQGAEIRYQTTGRRLFSDGNRVVCGILAEEDSGRELRIKAKKAVILATGGITHNPEMIEECMPGASQIPAHSCVGHTGIMHNASMEIGCQMYGRPWIYATEAKYPGYTSMDQYAELYIYGAVEVNLTGDRYIDESIYWCNERTRALLKQPTDPVDGICTWEILDQTAYDLALAAGPPIGLQESTVELLVSADNYEELGEKILSPNLAATMAKYNDDVARVGYDTVFGRETMLGVGTGPVAPLVTPPFYAFKNAPHFDYNPATSFYVDEQCRALNSFDEPIERLYQVGEIMLRSVIGNHYQYGLATGAGGTLGLYCGGLTAELDNWDA